MNYFSEWHVVLCYEWHEIATELQGVHVVILLFELVINLI